MTKYRATYRIRRGWRGGQIEPPKILGGATQYRCVKVYRDWGGGGGGGGGIIGNNAMGGYYTVGDNAMYSSGELRDWWQWS